MLKRPFDESGGSHPGRTKARPNANIDRTLFNVGFFRDVPAAITEKLDRQCRWLELEKGDVLVDAGENGGNVFFLLYGELRFFLYTETGKVLSLPAVPPGGFIGLSALTRQVIPPYSVDAAKNTVVASLNARSFWNVVREDASLVQALLMTASQRIESLIRNIEELTTLSVKDRVHAELIRLCSNNTNTDGSALIAPMPSHEELASRIGTQREAVSREIAHLQHAGIVERRKGGLYVSDVARLLDEND